MSAGTPIQWCDDSINPVAGCSVPCELRPSPAQTRAAVEKTFSEKLPKKKYAALSELLDKEIGNHNSTEIYQLRDIIVDRVFKKMAPDCDAKKIKVEIKTALDGIFICYAHQQHLMRGNDIRNPTKRTNPGFAQQFEQVTKFKHRTAEAAARPDLLGTTRKNKPWLDYLPRLIFVSDLGDALSEEVDFNYLKSEIVDVTSSTAGKRHIWLWLTKMPKRMAQFGNWLNEQGLEWPTNLVAMTTVTSQKTVNRAKQLLEVPAKIRGLSVEPLWEEVTIPSKGIDWCICGGQSGFGAKPFDVGWIESLQRQCKKSGAAIFVKQLGAKPFSKDGSIKLTEEHGGDWNEWPEQFQIREMPQAFYNYTGRD